MLSINDIADEIVGREGGFVNDPDDPGGPTKYGVTLRTLRSLGVDNDGDGDTDIADVRSLTKAQAREIFVKHYFERPRIAALPSVIHASVFDMYVNSGANAVRILQQLLGQMGQPVSVDGAIGPKTIDAAATAFSAARAHFADAYGIARRNYYYALADKRPASRKFARRRDGGKGGWIIRAEAFISPRYHFSDAAHRERTASWG